MKEVDRVWELTKKSSTYIFTKLFIKMLGGTTRFYIDLLGFGILSYLF